MGVFGAVFGRRGDAGFSGPSLGVCSGVVGFRVAMFLRACARYLSPCSARWGETSVAFARWFLCGVETAVAFTSEKWVFLVRFSGVEVTWVSAALCWGCAVVLSVSASPCSCVPVREKVHPARPGAGESAKKFALQARNRQKTAFPGTLGEYFRGNAGL